MHVPLLPHHPIVRPIVTFLFLTLILYSLLAHWQQHGGGKPMFDKGIENNAFVHEMDATKVAGAKPTAEVGKVGAVEIEDKLETPGGEARKVVAHFMLGNTFPFTALNWEETFDLAEDTGLDGLILNLGREEWQFRQARAAYMVAGKRIKMPVLGRKPIHLALSLDMDVRESDKWSDATHLTTQIASLLSSTAQLMYVGRPLLTAFGGHEAKWGGKGWQGFLDELNLKMQYKASFWPAFFQPPGDVLDTTYIDGAFSWNGAWPMANRHISLSPEDLQFIASDKPFMASVSPLFFTHYGNKGQWAFDKNWIYRSDDLLYPSRWAEILALSDKRAPEIVQVISWNDFGESHNIAPVLGVEPGSQKWTSGMDHIAFREMTRYFARRWRDGAPETTDDEIIVWMWYRTHPKSMTAMDDAIGKPENANWALDLINALVVVPDGLDNVELEITNGPSRHGGKHSRGLSAGRANAVTVPFQPGTVHFEVRSHEGVHMRHSAQEIFSKGNEYNFNMWSGAWRVKVGKAT